MPISVVQNPVKLVNRIWHIDKSWSLASLDYHRFKKGGCRRADPCSLPILPCVAIFPQFVVIFSLFNIFTNHHHLICHHQNQQLVVLLLSTIFFSRALVPQHPWETIRERLVYCESALSYQDASKQATAIIWNWVVWTYISLSPLETPTCYIYSQ